MYVSIGQAASMLVAMLVWRATKLKCASRAVSPQRNHRGKESWLD